jgi:hypothetical protein
MSATLTVTLDERGGEYRLDGDENADRLLIAVRMHAAIAKLAGDLARFADLCRCDQDKFVAFVAKSPVATRLVDPKVDWRTLPMLPAPEGVQ